MSLVVFLRGVNVGTAKRFQPKLLARELEHLGVSSLGAAGTFVVRGNRSQSALRTEFFRRLPFACDLMICQGRDLLNLVAADPFPEAEPNLDLRRFVSILARRPVSPPRLPWSFPAGDQWQLRMAGISGRFMLYHWRRREGGFVEPNGIIEKHLGVRATTRNWNTILRICSQLGEKQRS